MSRAAMIVAVVAALSTGTPVRAAKPAKAPGAVAAGCNTACLNTLANAFLDGLVSRKQGADVPWADRVRYTENGVGMTIGDGIWASVTAHGAAALAIADPSTDSIVWIGGIEEHGQPGWLALRLRQSGGRIADAEAIIRRKEGRPPFAAPAGFSRDPGFAQTAGVAPRERLIGLAQGYLNSIAANDGTVLTPIAPGCERTENGLTMTSGDIPLARLATGCEGQIKAGLFQDVDRLRGVVFPVVDEQRGLVVAIGMRDYSGRLATLTTADGRSVPADTAFPHSYAFAMVFKIKGGAIARIEEISTDVPYYMPAWKAR